MSSIMATADAPFSSHARRVAAGRRRQRRAAARPIDIDRAGACAELAQPVGHGLAGSTRARCVRPPAGRAERELGGEHRGVGAARAVRCAVGVSLALDLDRPPVASESRNRSTARVRCPPVSTTRAGSKRQQRPHKRFGFLLLLWPAGCSRATGEHTRLRQVRRQHARKRQDSSHQHPLARPASSSRAPDSATITGSTTIGRSRRQLARVPARPHPRRRRCRASRP